MTKQERRDALKRAQWRHSKAGKLCRLCGAHAPYGPYCLTHFRRLGPPTSHDGLGEAVARGERLEEADDLILVRSLFKGSRVALSEGGMIHVGGGRLLYRSTLSDGTGGYRLRHRDGHRLEEFHTIQAALTYLVERSRLYGSRNSFATKPLIL